MFKGIKEFFTYTNKERNGSFMLLIFILFGFAIQNIYEFGQALEPADFKEFDAVLAEIEEQKKELRSLEIEVGALPNSPFNPNTVDRKAWKSLGLKDHQINIIMNYKKSGGSFHKAEDLLKIYGIEEDWFSSIQQLINIPVIKDSIDLKPLLIFEKFNPNSIKKNELLAFGLSEKQANGIISFREKVHPFQYPADLYKVYNLDSSIVNEMQAYLEINDSIISEKEAGENRIKFQAININLCDSLGLLEVNGIGPYYAGEFIKYRDRLGGYNDLNQLLEIYSMDTNRVNKIRNQLFANSEDCLKININTVGFKDLLRHPYFDYEVVKNILKFRDEVRPYQSIDELRNIELIDEALFTKIAEYLIVGQ